MTFTGVTLDDFIDAVADRLAERLAERDDSLIDQKDRRGLVGRRHIDAVRRRIAAKAGGAYIRGRDYLLTPAAVRDELARGSAPAGNDNAMPRPRVAKGKAGARSSDELAQLKRELEAEMRGARNR